MRHRRGLPGNARWSATVPCLALLAALACTAIPPHPEIDDLDQSFSGELARAHRASLGGLIPRTPGTEADTLARGYLKRELGLAGADVRELEEGGRRHLVGEIEGRSSDLVLVVAAYPALDDLRWIDDSSAAILLELARVFGATEPPYTLQFALAEIRPERIGSDPDEKPTWQPLSTRFDASRMLVGAGESLARASLAEGGTGRVRAVVAIDVRDREVLRVARDLRSHPGFREVFWDSAADLGFGNVFPADGNWASPESLHLGFRTRSMDRVLALVDVGVDDVAAEGSTPDGDAERSDGLEAVGFVSVEALGRLMRRFEKVDAFAR